MDPLGSTKGSTNGYQHPYVFTCPVALTEVGLMTVWPCTLLLDSSLSQKHCFCLCVCVCCTYVCVYIYIYIYMHIKYLHHSSHQSVIMQANTIPECWKITSILAYLIRWKMFTDVTSLLLLPQFVILCALLAGFFCFFPVIFIYSWSLPLYCFSPSPMPSNLFVCQILHCTSVKIFKLCGDMHCLWYFTSKYYGAVVLDEL